MVYNKPLKYKQVSSKQFIYSRGYIVDPNIGIITALPKEYTAFKSLLLNPKSKSFPGRGAGREYCIGTIPANYGGNHNVVLSLADMGNNIAAIRASKMLTYFPNLNYLLMVGIAGGIPYPDKPDDHVRLGDIVVSSKKGVIQYDFIKREEKFVENRCSPIPPSAYLLEVVRLLQVKELERIRPWEKYIKTALKQLRWRRPKKADDILYKDKKKEQIVKHPRDPRRPGVWPRVFVAPISSANILLKDAKLRDKLRDQHGAKAAEMEGSGIADATWDHEKGYMVIRGICDYCDSAKGDQWQNYAAIVAAAYTRCLIENISGPVLYGDKESLSLNGISIPKKEYSPYNLPRAIPIVGRENDLNIIQHAIDKPYSIVVIEGLGGIGKTALAENIVNIFKKKHKFDLLVWISAKGRQLVLSNILDEIIIAIDFPYLTQLPHKSRLSETINILKGIKCLIIIDNFDSIKESSKNKIFNFLTDLTSNNKVLVTSRPPLPGEKLIPNGAFIYHLKGLTEENSIKLMVEKGRELNISTIQSKEIKVLKRLFIISGGNPLAIILSIGQLKVTSLSLEKIIEKLSEGRQELFDNIYKGSWELLSDEAQELLKASSLFSTSYSKDALAAIFSFSNHDFELYFTELIRLSLVDSNKSLTEDKLRFDLHPLTKAFAEAKLRNFQKQGNAYNIALANYYLAFTKKYEVRFWEGREIYAPLDAERLNILKILDWCWLKKRYQSYAEIVRAIADYLIVKGHWQLCFYYGEKAAIAASKINDDDLEAHITVHMQGYLHANRCEFNLAEEALKRALTLYRKTENKAGLSETLRNLGRVHRKKEEFDIANNFYEESHSFAIEIDDKKHIALIINEIGKLERDKGHLIKAMEMFVSAKDKIESVDNSIYAGILCNMAGVAIELEDFVNAEKFSNESLKFFIKIDNKEGIATTKWRLAEIYLKTDPVLGQKMAQESYQIFERLGMKQECSKLLESISNANIIGTMGCSID